MRPRALKWICAFACSLTFLLGPADSQQELMSDTEELLIGVENFRAFNEFRQAIELGHSFIDPIIKPTETGNPTNPNSPACCLIREGCCASFSELREQADEFKRFMASPNRLALQNIGLPKRVPEYSQIPAEVVAPPVEVAAASASNEADEIKRDWGILIEKGECENPLALPQSTADRLCDLKEVNRSSECSATVSKLMNEFRLIDSSVPPSGENYRPNYQRILTDLGGSRAASRMLPDYLEVLNAYVEYCLDPVSKISETLDQEAYSDLRSSVGSIKNSANPMLNCNGTYLNGRLYTARHCVVDATQVKLTSISNISFISMDGSVRVSFEKSDEYIFSDWYRENAEIKDIFDPTQTAEDVVVLVDRSWDGEESNLKIGSAKFGENLLIIGYNRNLEEKKRIIEDLKGILDVDEFGMSADEKQRIEYLISTTAVPSTVEERFRLDNGPFCFAVELSDDGCLRHLCQSDIESSGSPLIAIRNKVPVVVAIQARGYDTQTSSQCWSPRFSSKFINIAAQILGNVHD